MTTIRSAYSEKNRPTTVNNKPSMTKQSMQNELDINNIIKKYHKTGVLPNLQKLEGVYGEITSMDLQTALQKVTDAENAFAEVPAKIRNLFDNDAGKFIDYATNPKNIGQMQEWGLAEKPVNTPNSDIPSPDPVSSETPTITPSETPDPQP